MPYTVTPTAIADVLVLEPKVFGDARGFFFESFNAHDFAQATGLTHDFVQDNHSKSARGVLRGLHYQIQHPQGKLVRVVQGEVFDVAVDLRRRSPTFGQWAACELRDTTGHMLWIPPGFGHGFLVLEDNTDFLYKTTDFYTPKSEAAVAWNDKAIGIQWPIDITRESVILSDKDRQAPALSDARVFD